MVGFPMAVSAAWLLIISEVPIGELLYPSSAADLSGAAGTTYNQQEIISSTERESEKKKSKKCLFSRSDSSVLRVRNQCRQVNRLHQVLLPVKRKSTDTSLNTESVYVIP